MVMSSITRCGPTDYDSVDPFWAYGYGDIYQAIFSPDSYDDYVQGPAAPARMATSDPRAWRKAASEEAAEVTGWPISQIQDAVQPDQQQSSLLDNLGNAVVKASDEVESHCPTSVSFTPTGRLAAMQQNKTNETRADCSIAGGNRRRRRARRDGKCLVRSAQSSPCAPDSQAWRAPTHSRAG